MNLHEFLWSDRAVFDARYEEDAATYLAVVHALREHRPLDGAEDEFLALHEFVAALDPNVFTTVWHDPYAHFWVRSAFALTAAVLRGTPLPPRLAAHGCDAGSDEPSRVLAAHLADFKRLALGAALVGDVDLTLRSPLDTALPMAVPGTVWSLEGTGRLQLAAVNGGDLLDAAGRVVPKQACPVAREDDFELRLQPYGFHVPGMSFRPAAADTDLDYQATQVPLLDEGLALVKRYQPETLEQMKGLMQWVAVNPEIGDDSFASDSNLPGSFSLVCVRHPYVIASACIHEFHHNRLFFLEDARPILAGDRLGTEDEADYYSPWREQPRPLRGLLHALYVYVPEGRFWLSVALDADTDEAVRALAIDRSIRIPLQLALGIEQLTRFGRFTEEGRPVFDQLVADARDVIEECRVAGLPDDVSANYVESDGSLRSRMRADGRGRLTSRGLIAEHIERFDTQGQIESINPARRG